MPTLLLPTQDSAPAALPAGAAARPKAIPETAAPGRVPPRYWNRRLDALQWKRPARGGRRSWDRAFQSFLAPDTRWAFAMLGDLAGQRVLDLACGTGEGTLHLARGGATVVGLDLAYRRCAVAHRHTGSWVAPGTATFCAGRAERLPFADGSFDAIFARDILMYTDPHVTARECHRLLRPGGRAVFMEALEGHPLLRAFRRFTSPPEYLAFTRHLSWSELTESVRPLMPFEQRAHYLLSLAAFGALFLLRSERLHQAGLRLLEPLDRWLFRACPALARWAWRGSVLCVRNTDAR